MAANYMDLMKKKPFIGPVLPNSDMANGLKAVRDQAKSANTSIMDKQNEPVFKAPAAFSYDANTDPSYQAALRQAQQGAQTATNNAMVSLGSRGIGNSSIAVDRGNQIQQQAIGNVNDTILPQLMSQAYGRYQDQNNNDYRNALANYNVGRDKVGDNQWQQTYDAGRTDQAENLAINKGQLTGNYQSPESAGYNAEMLANSSAYKGATPEKQKELHDRNMVLAKMLGKTYDPKTGTYSEGEGTRTIQGQNQDFTQGMALKGANWNAYKDAVDMTGNLGSGPKSDWGQLPGQMGKPSYPAQQQNTQNTAQYTGYYQGMPTMQKIMNDNTIKNMTADNLRQAGAEARAAGNQQLATKFDIWDRTGKAPDGIPGVTPGTAMPGKTPTTLKESDIADLIDKSPYIQKQYDDEGRVIGSTVDPAQKQALSQYIASLGLPPEQAKQWFIRYGLWSPSGN